MLPVTAPGTSRPKQQPSSSNRRRLVLGLVALVVVLVVVVILSLLFGTRTTGAGSAVRALFDYDGSSLDQATVRENRLPRTVVGLVAGALLGLGGAVMQGVTRNPLADPGLLGVDAGAALAVVVALTVLGVLSPSGYVWFAFAGAAIVSVAVYGIGSAGRDGATPVKLALAGAAVTAALTSLTTVVLLRDPSTFDSYRFWLIGSISARRIGLLDDLAPLLVVGVLAALALGRALNGLALGDDAARGLGMHVGRVRLACAAVVVLTCGMATALCGPIVFLGLVVPHAVRAITGPDYRWLLPYSMVGGPALLLGADVVGRLLAYPSGIRVGVMMPLIGAPFFIALVRRRRLAEL